MASRTLHIYNKVSEGVMKIISETLKKIFQ